MKSPENKNEPAKRGPVELVRFNLPVAVMPVMVPVTMPADFGRRSLRAFRDRGDTGGIGQRQGLSLLCRSSKDQDRTDCRQAQNSRHLH
jgi:hypothetical protein